MSRVDLKSLLRFLSLPFNVQCLLIKASIFVFVMRIGLWLLPFQTLRRFLASRTRNDLREAPALHTAVRLSWAVQTVSRYVPRATCLTQALAVRELLLREGHGAQLRLGVAYEKEVGFQSHAWVESQGNVLIGATELGKYTPLSGIGV